MVNLTSLLKAKNLNDFIGQKHLIGEGSALLQLIEKKDIPHLFFYGKPGTGKTTLAKIIAKEMELDFYPFNATTIKIEDLRKVFARYENALLKPLIFIDEVHRLSKTQQEVLLPIMEDYKAVIIGASTENPFFTLTSAIRSRSFLFEFKAHTIDDLSLLLQKAIKELKDITITDEAKEHLLYSSGGDARALLNLLDFAYKVSGDITLDLLKQLRPHTLSEGVSCKDSHYDLASAMIKSIRGSDIDASVYYMSRLINAGESVEFITRRLVISASEDIGNANPNAITIASSIQTSANKIGYPEARILLSQCVVYLASSPKSRASYMAVNNALADIKSGKILEVPQNIKDKHIGYKNPHEYGGYIDQNYLQKDLKYYTSSNIGFEKTLNEWVKKIKGIN